MTFSPPVNDKILSVFPELADLKKFADGGFKIVYSAKVATGSEVFKLVCLPQVGSTDEERAEYRREALGRIRREVGLLAKCRCPELVKLGSVPPRLVTIDGVEYVGYTEEHLPGESLGQIIRRKGAKPHEAEAHRLVLALLRAIEELWNKYRTIHRDIKPE